MNTKLEELFPDHNSHPGSKNNNQKTPKKFRRQQALSRKLNRKNLKPRRRGKRKKA